MRAGVTTRLETMDGLGDFPTTAELASRTRRLAFRFDDDDGASVWWHAVEAGDDATGRPGNVFTHSVAIAGLPDTLRPIDLWRSPSWLMPFGQKEVAEASLREFEPTETPPPSSRDRARLCPARGDRGIARVLSRIASTRGGPSSSRPSRRMSSPRGSRSSRT